MSTAFAVVHRELLAAGASPGSDIHSWRCAHPDRYGHCDCVYDAANEIVDALRAEGLLA